MDDEIALVKDGDSLAVVGNGPKVAERFLAAEGLTSRDLGLHRLGPSLGTGALPDWGRSCRRLPGSPPTGAAG